MRKTLKINYKNPIHLCAIGFGSGLSTKCPGTIGSLVALVVFPLLQYLPQNILWMFLVVAIVFGIWICDVTSKYMQLKDAPQIVWDEFCGLWLALGLINYYSATKMTIADYLIGFLLFRLFDIMKPWPISFFDKKVNGGLGIMLDDLFAGFFAAIISCIIINYNYFYIV